MHCYGLTCFCKIISMQTEIYQYACMALTMQVTLSYLLVLYTLHIYIVKYVEAFLLCDSTGISNHSCYHQFLYFLVYTTYLT